MADQFELQIAPRHAAEAGDFQARLSRTFGTLSHTLSAQPSVVEDEPAHAEVLLDQRVAGILKANQLPPLAPSASTGHAQWMEEDDDGPSEGEDEPRDLPRERRREESDSQPRPRGVPVRFQDKAQYTHYSLDDVQETSDAQNRAIAAQFLASRGDFDEAEPATRIVLPEECNRVRPKPAAAQVEAESAVVRVHALPRMIHADEEVKSEPFQPRNRRLHLAARRTIRKATRAPPRIAEEDEEEDEEEQIDMSKKVRSCVFLDHLRHTD